MAEEAEHDDIPTASEAAHYRGLAHSLRELARQCRIARARLELVQLAVKFEQRAERLASRVGDDCHSRANAG